MFCAILRDAMNFNLFSMYIETIMEHPTVFQELANMTEIRTIAGLKGWINMFGWGVSETAGYKNQ